jgi:hypothetical protein
MPAQGCGKSSCSECNELGGFLFSEEQKIIHFSWPRNERWHVQNLVKENGLIKFETGWVSEVLTVTKIQTVFQRDLALYERKMKFLEGLLGPLKSEYLQRLLGNDMYQKLVVLEGHRPSAENVGRKRSAEERSDEDAKRARITGEHEVSET